LPTRVRALAITGSLLSLSACGSSHKRVDWARAYPEQTARSGTLDIQVVREATRVRLTNTSDRAFGESTLWLNMQWACPIDSFGVGQTLDLALDEFRNEHHEAFRAGGFFAAERPDMIVLAQIETTGETGERELVDLVAIQSEEIE
jgi:hypothetical protein